MRLVSLPGTSRSPLEKLIATTAHLFGIQRSVSVGAVGGIVSAFQVALEALAFGIVILAMVTQVNSRALLVDSFGRGGHRLGRYSCGSS